MIRTGQQYRNSIRDGRQVWINGERVKDVTTHPMFRPLVDIRARIYDMAHEARHAAAMTYRDDAGETAPSARSCRCTPEDWHAKRAAVDAVLDEVGGIVTRVGDETVGEMWSLYDGQDVLNEVNPQFSANIRRHVDRGGDGRSVPCLGEHRPEGRPLEAAAGSGPGHAAARGQGDRCRHHRARRQIRDGGGLCQPGVHQADDRQLGRCELSDYAVGFICDLSAPNLKFICRTGFAGRAPIEDYPLANRFDEVDTLLIFDDVLIPWEDVLFYRHTKAATFIRATLHRYSAFAFVQRNIKLADMMIGAALFNARQTGLEQQQAVQEKLAQLACYREGINAHLTAAIAMAKRSPAGLLMPNQSLLMTGRVLASSQLHQMMHIARELCGGQICVTPDAATFADPETAPGWRSTIRSMRLAGGGSAQAAGLRPGPAELRLRRASADVPVFRAVAAVCAPGGGVSQFRLGGVVARGAVIGCTPLPKGRLFSGGDYSYGIYLFGRPIQQTIVAFLPAGSRVIVNFPVSLTLAISVAILSWHLVEKRVLGMRKHIASSDTTVRRYYLARCGALAAIIGYAIAMARVTGIALNGELGIEKLGAVVAFVVIVALGGAAVPPLVAILPLHWRFRSPDTPGRAD